MRESQVQQRVRGKKREDKAKILALIATGTRPHDAVRAVGRNIAIYEQWRMEDKEWAQRVTAARVTGGDDSLPHRDFVAFRQTFFGHDTPPHHYRMIEANERASPGTITMILGWPQCAKTSLLVDFVNWRLGPKDPNWRECVISEGQDLARKILGQVANRMTDEALFREYIMAFGPFKAPDRDVAKPWNADFLQILRSRNDEKEPSLEARGAGSTLYGGRYDNIDLDDIQSEKTIQLTRKLLTYIRQTVLTRPDRERGRTTFWGSRVGPGDIYEAMLEEGMVDNLVVLPAMSAWVDRDQHFDISRKRGGEKVYHVNPDCPAQPTWDQGPGTMEFLARMRDKVGEEIWTRTFMQENFSAGAQTFTEEMIEGAKDRERGIGHARNLGVTGILMVDPALESGQCAFMSARYNAERFWITDALERHDIARTEDILDEIDHWATVHRPSVLVVEQNNFQKALVRDTRLDALAKRHGFRIEGHQTGRNKLDPVMGVSAMASSFVRGEISIPWADDVTRGRMGVLVDELRSWRRNVRGRDLKQDLVMALWFGWVLWEAERETLRYKGSNWRIGGMPFKPTGYGPVMAGARS